jgi:predicted enzyme related to lactoylglutathione lyase
MAKSENDRRIDYVEMGVADLERAKGFYGRAFGWTFTDYGPSYCGVGWSAAFDKVRLTSRKITKEYIA